MPENDLLTSIMGFMYTEEVARRLLWIVAPVIGILSIPILSGAKMSFGKLF